MSFLELEDHEMRNDELGTCIPVFRCSVIGSWAFAYWFFIGNEKMMSKGMGGVFPLLGWRVELERCSEVERVAVGMVKDGDC